MHDPEEKKAESELEPELESSSVSEESTLSLNELSEVLANDELPKVTFSESPISSQKVELKKHSLVAPNSPPSVVNLDVLSSPPADSKNEIPTPLSETGLEIEVSFILDRKKIPLTLLSTLAEGEVIGLSGADFKATLFLQDRAFAEAELIMVDQKPSIQITKIFSDA